MTGITYRFNHSGATILVDPRDVASLSAVPNLKRARAPQR
jgi:hypothetical protein